MTAGVYLHIPFCKSRCSYCDFATDIYRDGAVVQRYVNALCKEIREGVTAGVEVYGSGDARVSADTVYFGGGTPSLLSPTQVEEMLAAVRSSFDISSDAEITMEMNPATVSPETLGLYRQLGVNRASFGVQTFNDRALKLLARGHNANEARDTFRMLREAGFENISFDLIAGLPGQSLDDWRTNLDEAVALQPEHISLYLLEIHEGTPLAEQVGSGRRQRPDDGVAAEMYGVMLDHLAAAGYGQYEISNFSKPGYESRHNTKYWRLDHVYGFGVSAHSFNGRERFANERDTGKYVSMAEGSGSAEVFREAVDQSSEAAFLGMRLEKGIDLTQYRRKFGKDLLVDHRNDISDLQANGLIAIDSQRMYLTRKGKLFSNEVFAVFV